MRQQSKSKRVTTCLAALGLAGLLLATAGCEAMGFYPQAIWGQLSLLSQRQSVEQIVSAKKLDQATLDKLQLAQDILDYGERVLGLDVEKRYRAYVPLEADAVVWNVFAAQPFDVEGHQWCYPVVGCTTYRGYFSEARAQRVAARYESSGYDTYVGGVSAYSTLGWFNDPLLSTFLHWPEADLANLLLHELAHSKVWVNDDVAFNESFATFVGREGARDYFAVNGRMAEWHAWEKRSATRFVFRDFLLQAKQHVQAAYSRSQQSTHQQRLAVKQAAFSAVHGCYQANRLKLGEGRYDATMQRLNNAYFVSVGTYEDYVPAFAQLFAQSSNHWASFFQKVDELGALEATARAAALARLGNLAQDQVSHRADHKDTDNIHCESFFNHSLDSEAPS